MNSPDIILNPKLDREALKKAFYRDRRLHIPEIVNPEAAEEAHRSLNQDIAWNLAYNDETGQQDLFATRQQEMSQRERQIFHQKINTRAKSGKFTYLYGSYAIGDLYKRGQDKDLFIARMFEFVNSQPVLNLIRTVTGFKTVKRASMQATAYGPGHFLTDHNDFEPKKDRKVAYVLNLTKNWKPEWGGLLEFPDEAGTFTAGLVPSFNALNIFSVPQRHIVTQVATYAPGVRFALTGWFLGNDAD